eukprot:6110745-Pleurochrysis_carterae.AAC.1
MDPRAWVGMNLGRSWLSPGAYNVWVPSANKIVTTSDVYFNELSFPWRPNSDAVPSLAQPSDADSTQPPGLLPGKDSVPLANGDLSGPSHLIAAPSATPKAKRALLLFSGPIHRRDGIAAFLSRFDYPADSVDNDPHE